MWKHQSSIARPACMEVAIITCSLFICVTQTLIRRSEAYTDLRSPAVETNQTNPKFYLQYAVVMMRCSLIIYQPFCHFLSPCYDCVPCSCVRPGIQWGLSVRGTFRVSQTVPVSIRSISLPGLSVWLPLGSPEACLKRTNHQLSIRTLLPFHLSGLSRLAPPHARPAPARRPRGLRTSQSAPHCAHIADTVAYKGPIPEPLLFQLPIPSPVSASIPL